MAEAPLSWGCLVNATFPMFGLFRALGLRVGISCHGSGLGVLGRSRGENA